MAGFLLTYATWLPQIIFMYISIPVFTAFLHMAYNISTDKFRRGNIYVVERVYPQNTFNDTLAILLSLPRVMIADYNVWVTIKYYLQV